MTKTRCLCSQPKTTSFVLFWPQKFQQDLLFMLSKVFQFFSKTFCIEIYNFHYLSSFTRLLVSQCDQINRLFGHLQRWKFAQKHKRFPRLGSTFCQTQNKPSRNGSKNLNFGQGGKIWPNLFPLLVCEG